MSKLQDLKNAVANATTQLTNATNDAQNKLSDLNRCNCGKGKLLVAQGGNPAGTCTPLKNQIIFPNLGNPVDCIQPPNINNCKTDCCSQSTCVSRVNTYNNAIGIYNSAKSNLQVAQNALDNALKNDPDVQQENQNIIDQDKNRKIKNGIIVTIVVAAIITTFLWLDKKYFHIFLK